MNANNCIKQMPREYFFTNVEEKIMDRPQLKTRLYFCMWSDLLGFGNQFFQNNWQLSETDKFQIYLRLNNAHSIVLQQTSPSERVFILNDGIAKVTEIKLSPTDLTPLLNVSLFFRGIILTHINIIQSENKTNLPGCRTVVSFGEGIEYITREIKYDDFLFNYCRKNPHELGKSSKINGNPTILYNPVELQMNTAFSKSYILESGGSKAGLSGANLFIDSSVLNVMDKLCEMHKYEKVISESADTICILYKHPDDVNRVYLGFELSKPIKPTGIPWQTEVFKILRFYPHDEDINEFWFDLVNIGANFK